MLLPARSCLNQLLRRFGNVGLSRSYASFSQGTTLRRSRLYIPCSSDKLISKALTSPSDMVIFDLEDSVAPSVASKRDARTRLRDFLIHHSGDLDSTRIAVRVNSVDTPFFVQDIDFIRPCTAVSTIVLPKIHSVDDLDCVVAVARDLPWALVSSVESARAQWNLGSIASWHPAVGSVSNLRLRALLRKIVMLFPAVTDCADTGIARTPSRRGLLYTRSHISIAAKVHGLEAIDMVCVNYKDEEHLKDECLDGRELGFTGKQAIHPSQVDIIQRSFVPTSAEILRAAKIIHQIETAYESKRQDGTEMGTGALGLDGEMIDAPMLKQAMKTIGIAKLAGLETPNIV
ncbi:beta subunit of citrate lyase [Fistulina hepatica ATCC 64428]|uniref:Beta subunit of citrate lyase n=1 Tax=Fistulina hepatica ATCC 64428 TaxID=1128425 RepID=A0A0D7A317_9AGAR|nr:beta subunit of citrate lyase [Fistulina hepatica ATCC 64428]